MQGSWRGIVSRNLIVKWLQIYFNQINFSFPSFFQNVCANLLRELDHCLLSFFLHELVSAITRTSTASADSFPSTLNQFVITTSPLELRWSCKNWSWSKTKIIRPKKYFQFMIAVHASVSVAAPIRSKIHSFDVQKENGNRDGNSQLWYSGEWKTLRRLVQFIMFDPRSHTISIPFQHAICCDALAVLVFDFSSHRR